MAEKAAKKAEEAGSTQGEERLFTKGQLISSSRFMARRDLLEALLEEDRGYSVNEAEGIIKKFMERKVE